MTWRERIVAARERGRFTDEDQKRARDVRTCAVGECSAAVGKDHDWYTGLSREHTDSGYFTQRVLRHEPDEAERALDRIEDRILQAKREGLV